MGLLDRGQSFLNRRLKQAGGVSVVYSRKVQTGTQTVSLIARIGRTVFSGLVESGVSVVFGERDYLIEVVDLILNGIATTPQKGDRITENDVVWEVTTPQTDEPCWRYSDLTRTVYRIHVKRA